MKTCTICKEVKERTEYNKKKSASDGLQNVCRECNRKRSRKYYKTNNAKHRKKVRARNKRVVLELKQKIDAVKAAYGCQLCPENDVVCLDFHHLGKKDFAVASSPYEVQNWERIKNEIRKCVVLCSNCHRKVHAGKKQLKGKETCLID